MARARRRTPQEKKRLSLKKDFREDFGQNDKASRRLVPLRKKQANRALRRTDKADLVRDPEAAERKLPKRRKGRWKKCAGQRLQAAIERKAARRRQGKNRREKQARAGELLPKLLSGELTGAAYRAALQEIWEGSAQQPPTP